MREVREFRMQWVVSQEVQDVTTRVSLLIGLPPVVTYEGVVLLNTSFAHTFESGSVGESEKFFYRVHNDIELILYPAITKFLKSLAQEDIWSTLDALRNLSTAINKSLDGFRNFYRNLNTEDFNMFRQNFLSLPHRWERGILYPGASGASSASIPSLDILFGVKRVNPPSPLTDTVRPELRERGYATNQEIQQALETVENISLRERFSEYPDILSQLDRCIEQLLLFRKWHEGNIKKHLPQAYSSASGSGGSLDIPTYIWQTIKNTERVLNQ